VKEHLIASDFSCPMPDRPSVLAPGAVVPGDYDHYYCPRCRTRVHKLLHGVAKTCKCGLTMTRYGNGLDIEMDVVDKTAPVGQAAN
jgi:hypothetical protein